ncbi:MAG TPA: Ig-like domain-containing protein, partial [Nitrosopumilaceae archaeon]|nr:Ig-like domain-containing protein [Nitrosopumilaceae archaeon]
MKQIGYFRVKAFDIAGNSASSQVAVNVSNVGTAPPLVSMTNPVAGSTVTGKVTVSVSASASSGISNVQI